MSNKRDATMIRIHNDTKEKLDDLKIYKSQTYNDCIRHLIIKCQALEKDKELFRSLLEKRK